MNTIEKIKYVIQKIELSFLRVRISLSYQCDHNPMTLGLTLLCLLAIPLFYLIQYFFDILHLEDEILMGVNAPIFIKFLLEPLLFTSSFFIFYLMLMVWMRACVMNPKKLKHKKEKRDKLSHWLNRQRIAIHINKPLITQKNRIHKI